MQHDFNIANQGFPATRSDINNALAALASTSSGASEPSTTYANQFWYDTTNNLLKFRNEADSAWITLAYLDQATNEWEIRSAVIQAVDSAGVIIKTDDGTARVTVADTGLVTIANGLTIDNSASTVLTVDRATSDGIIIDVQKDGTTVGWFGTQGGQFRTNAGSQDYYITLNGGVDATANDVYVQGNTSPWINNYYNLGNGSEKWKDLYLSGGVYLGGTGSANKLSDYEEGSWTPTLKLGATAVTQSSTVARYTKIGRQVTVFLETYITNLNSGSGTFNISGLPFNNIAGMRSAQSQFFFQFMSSSFPSGAKQGYIDSNGANISVGYFTGSSGTAASLNESHFTTASYVYANMTYFTN